MRLVLIVMIVTGLHLQLEAKICQSIAVRNTVDDLQQLNNCSVVEGYVQIKLIELANETDFQPWTFPELREITQYLLFYRVKGLRSIGQLFPNLVRIGGAKLLSDSGLIVHEMVSLQEIGLVSLREISRGSVIISKNPSLCYVNTINWTMIANWDPDKNYVANNKNSSDCPGCLPHCPKGLCWSVNECQIQSQPIKCHPLCIGGCSAPGPAGCHACRGVLTVDNLCVETCPPETYVYLNRRCVKREECLSIGRRRMESKPTAFPDPSEEAVKYVVFNGTCTDSCPPGYEFDTSVTSCKPCVGGKCQKTCPGMCIEKIVDAQVLKGCTYINGSLEINIKYGNSKIVAEELEQNLGSIEEIEKYLKVVRSFPIVNLNFLKNLTTIHGIYSDSGFGGNYSLLVIENQNIQDLWDWKLKPNFKILRGKVFFHFNPKLCLEQIQKLLTVIHHDKNVSDMEVGKNSNGDKFHCNAGELPINVIHRLHNMIQIQIPFIQFNSSILRYVVYFAKDPYKNMSMLDDLDLCSDYGWKTIDVSVELGSKEREIKVNLTDLEPYTQYGFYVTTYTFAGLGARSSIYYEYTLPATPLELTRLVAFPNNKSQIVVQWVPPKKINGKLQEYIVEWTLLEYDKDYFTQRNYCEYPMVYINETTIPQPTLPVINKKGDSCCKLERQAYVPKEGFEMLCSNFHHCQINTKRCDSDKDLSNSCESCFYSYIYKNPFPSYFKESYSMHSKTSHSSFTGNRISSQRPIKSTSRSRSIQRSSTEYVIGGILHFRDYIVSVKACRERDPREDNLSENDRCSKKDMVVVRSQKNNEADKIPSIISYYILNGTVFLSWDSPVNPNGPIVAFEVEHRMSTGGSTNPILDCITYSEFESNNGAFVIAGLAPGRYEARIRAISVAGKGPFTDYIYFKISSEIFSVIDILFIAIGLCFVISIAVFAFTTYQKKKNVSILVASVNPDYHYIQDHWEIRREDVTLIRELGSGSFGTVYEGILKPDIPCAVKTVSDDATLYDTYVFLSEASVMKSVSGAFHIVRLLGVVSIGKPPLVLMELMSRGDLKTYLRLSRELQPPSNATMIRMALQIADGMAFMEAKKFVHRDLAARNCMVSNDCVVKVGDFGMTRDVYETDYYRKNSTGLLPIRWMPPESLQDGVFTSQSDVWSFGVVLWEIVTLAEQPYQGSSNDQVLQDVVAGRRLDIPRQSPETLVNIMTTCWRRKPSQRMSFMQIVNSLEYYHDDEFKMVSYYHSEEAVSLRKGSSDYVEMRSVEDPLLGGASSSETHPRSTQSTFLSKIKSVGRSDRLSQIDEVESYSSGLNQEM